jgi:putative phage-type endonuclease
MNAPIIQRTEEWFQARLGRVTASRMADMTARTKSGWGASRANYMYELLLERLNGRPLPGYQSAAMLQGTEREPEARTAYCFMANCEVKEVGFVPHPVIDMAGCSPDGLVGDEGLVEVKCPEPKAHWTCLRTEQVDERYIKQVQFQLCCTGRSWCDYVSWNPDFPAPMQFFRKRIERNERMIYELETQTLEFLDELDRELAWAHAHFNLRSEAA